MATKLPQRQAHLIGTMLLTIMQTDNYMRFTKVAHGMRRCTLVHTHTPHTQTHIHAHKSHTHARTTHTYTHTHTHTCTVTHTQKTGALRGLTLTVALRGLTQALRGLTLLRPYSGAGRGPDVV